jgi:hypothetical protein
MDENLEEIIKISLKFDSFNAEYYLSKYITYLISLKNNITTLQDQYVDEENDYSNFNTYESRLNILQSKIDRLTMIKSRFRNNQ